jgi:RND family efflux transporter MFP subunit
MKKKILLIIGAFTLLLTVTIWVVSRPKEAKLAQRYDFFTIKHQDLVEKVDATGRIENQEKKDLYTDFEAVVEKVHVKAGDKVKQGDIIVSLNSAVLKEQLQEAESALEQAKVGSKQAATQLATEMALNRVSENNALQLESYYHQWALSREQEQQAKQRIKSLNVKNDNIYDAKNDKLVIRAPFSGQVGWVNARQGEKVTPQTLIATIINPTALSVEAHIDQNDITLIELGQKAIVTGKDEAQTENLGEVKEIGKLGQAEGEIVNFPVRIGIDSKTEGLHPGMTVDVTVMAREYKNVLVVPAGSVTRKDGKDRVNLCRDDKLVPVAVELGYKQGKFYEVKSGLKAGDVVAVPKLTSTSQRSTMPGPGGRGGMVPVRR